MLAQRQQRGAPRGGGRQDRAHRGEHRSLLNANKTFFHRIERIVYTVIIGL
jgi:hypothetical protein